MGKANMQARCTGVFLRSIFPSSFVSLDDGGCCDHVLQFLATCPLCLAGLPALVLQEAVTTLCSSCAPLKIHLASFKTKTK